MSGPIIALRSGYEMAFTLGHMTVFAPLAIARDRCKGCELCIAACPKHVLALDESTVNVLGYHPVELLDAAGCTSCAFCARVCPDAVFTVYAAPRKEAAG